MSKDEPRTKSIREKVISDSMSRVRARLGRWLDFNQGRAESMPDESDSPIERAADRIYFMRVRPQYASGDFSELPDAEICSSMEFQRVVGGLVIQAELETADRESRVKTMCLNYSLKF
jgi:hypothetical protein